MRGAIVMTLLLMASCALPEGTAYNPNPPPPPLRSEVIPKPPVTETLLIWQPGHWDWTGSGYVWQPGQFVAREGHGPLWLEGHWETRGSGWAWVAAHWVS